MRSAIYQAINGSASGSIVSESIPTDYMTQCSVIAVVAGATSPVGTVKLQASNDISNAFPIGNYDPTNWVDVPLAQVSISANGIYVIPATGLSYGFVRAVWTRTSGSGGTVMANVSLSDGAFGGSGLAAPIGPAGGDLSGTYPNPTVAAIEGIPIEAGGPANGDALLYNSSTARWEHAPIVYSGGPPTGPAGGSLAGIYPNPSLSAVGTAGTYGSSTSVPVITTSSEGRVTGVTPTAIAFPAAPTSLPMKVGNIAVVDTVNGNDGTGSINGLPYKTVEAGLAAITSAGTPATLWIMPGTYTLASATTGLTMPTGCTMRGHNTQTTRIVMNASNPGGTVTLLTMAENSRVEDLTLLLNSSNATTNLVGVNTPGTSSVTSKIRTAVVTVDNSGLATGTTTNVYGILDNGSGTLGPASFSFNFTRGVTINVFSNGGGNKRAVYVSTANDITFRDTNFYVAAPVDSASTGCYVGVETINASASAQFRTSSISGPSTAGSYTGSDIFQTSPGTGFINAGIQLGPGCDLVNKTAGGKPFTTYVTPTVITYSANAGLVAATRYLWPGVLTNAGDSTEVFQRVQQKSIIQGMSFFVRTAPGTGKNLTVTVLKSSTGLAGSGVATAMTQTISGATKLGTQYTVSVDLLIGEFFAIEISGTAGTSAADLTVQLDLF